MLAQPVNLVTADLGRHIENGRLIMSGDFSVLNTNTYSYTAPDFKAVNHHWLGGVLFFLIWKVSGFIGLHLVFILLSLITLLVFFDIARKKSKASWAGLITLLIMPLLLERGEVRPEIFSYLLAAIFFWLMFKFKRDEISFRWLWLIPVLEILWVNSHIYFFLGPVIIGTFWLESLILRTSSLKNLSWLLAATTLVTLINPFGIKGALMPLSIFNNFGYALAENQSVWFMQNFKSELNYIVFEIVFSLLILSLVAVWLKTKKIDWVNLIFSLGFSLAAWLAIRNLAIFGLFALPILAENLSLIFKNINWFKFNLILAGLAGIIFLSLISGELTAIYPYNDFGLGLDPQSAEAAQFITSSKIAGPIFNNYDIGSFLIFCFYSQEKVYPEQSRRVFVDNRPEFYPAGFFQNTYIPMQADEKIWQEKLKEYGFKTIIFSPLDLTPWGQTFLANRLNDPAWQISFKNARVIIFKRK